MDSKSYQVKNFKISNETYFNQLNKTPEQTTRTFLHRTSNKIIRVIVMNNHFPSQSLKSFPYCPLLGENNTTKSETPCVIYCKKIIELLKKNSTINVLKEIMEDDSYLKILGSLNTLTQSVI